MPGNSSPLCLVCNGCPVCTHSTLLNLYDCPVKYSESAISRGPSPNLRGWKGPPLTFVPEYIHPSLSGRPAVYSIFKEPLPTRPRLTLFKKKPSFRIPDLFPLRFSPPKFFPTKSVKYRCQIAQCLGEYLTADRDLYQLSTHQAFRRRDKFVTTFMSAPFMAHVAKCKTEDPFYLGTLRRLAGGMPVKVELTRSVTMATTTMTMTTMTTKNMKNRRQARMTSMP